jgi:hypothetical protein
LRDRTGLHHEEPGSHQSASLETIGETGPDVIGDVELFDHNLASIRMKNANEVDSCACNLSHRQAE